MTYMKLRFWTVVELKKTSDQIGESMHIKICHVCHMHTIKVNLFSCKGSNSAILIFASLVNEGHFLKNNSPGSHFILEGPICCQRETNRQSLSCLPLKNDRVDGRKEGDGEHCGVPIYILNLSKFFSFIPSQ